MDGCRSQVLGAADHEQSLGDAGERLDVVVVEGVDERDECLTGSGVAAGGLAGEL